MRKALAAIVPVALVGSSLSAREPAASSAEERYEQIKGWEGRWNVEEVDALQIVFEQTARGHTMVERWETASGLHSMTVYHVDGDAIVATHYCPQGNQPSLVSGSGDLKTIAFEFRDMTGLDKGESHTHSLSFTQNLEGSLHRREVYMESSGLGDPTTLTLVRSPQAD